MIVQVYRNTEKGRILLHNAKYPLDKERCDGYVLIDEFHGENWSECNDQINKKYFSEKCEDEYTYK